MLFLADIPDQVRLLTIYGRLKMGFRNASGQEVEFVVADDAAADPDADASRARAPATSIALDEINGRGFIDVTFNVPARHSARQRLDRRPRARVRRSRAGAQVAAPGRHAGARPARHGEHATATGCSAA